MTKPILDVLKSMIIEAYGRPERVDKSLTDFLSRMETTCINCKQKFSALNVFTEEGWSETKISGLCEACFDDITIFEE